MREEAVALHRLRRQIERPAEEKIRIRAEAPFISAIESPVGSHDRNRGAAEDIALRAADRVVRSSGRPNGIGLRRDGSDRPRSLFAKQLRAGRDVRDAS